jgi:hypothetical protein
MAEAKRSKKIAEAAFSPQGARDFPNPAPTPRIVENLLSLAHALHPA